MKKVEMNDFYKFNFLGNLKSSPKNTVAAWIQSKPIEEENEYHHDLYVLQNQKVDKVKSLKTNFDYIFIDENCMLIDYQKNNQERNQLKEKYKKTFYYYYLNEKKLEKAFVLNVPFKLEKLIDSERILLSAQLKVEDHILYEGSELARDEYIKSIKKNKVYEDINEIPYYFNGRGFSSGQNKQLFVYHIKSKQIKRLFEPAFSVDIFTLSQDNKSLYFTGKYAEKVKTFTSKIYQLILQSNKIDVLYNHLDYRIEKILDLNSIVVVASDMIPYGINQNSKFYRLEHGKLVLLNDYQDSIGNSIGSDCRLLASSQSFIEGNQWYFMSTVNDHSQLLTIDEHGQLNTLYTMEGSIDGIIMNQNRILMIGMKEQNLQEIYSFSGNTISPLTSVNKNPFKNKYVAKPKEVILKKEGFDIHGFVLLPQGFNPNIKYPMILDIHGGPKTVYGKIYYHEMQVWANQGFVVAFCNPRGSDGKGNEFADIRGKYGTIDYADIMEFTDQVLVEYTNIDQSRLYVTGGSYGGFMTNWILGHSHRFKAAASQRSISNWISFYGTSDIGYYFASDQTAGHPILDFDQLYEQSPIKYAMNVQTPLLFIHSDEDYRCPIEQAQQFYAILKTRAIDTKLIWFKGENHELSRSGKPQGRIKRLNEISQWFESH
ncbi:MAG: alpha/beta hydrolase family protein [Candidatus Izemoplasmatales bacterium]